MMSISVEPVPRLVMGARVLIVEDEMMIAMLLEDLLKSYGYRVVGPASRIAKALELTSSEAIDGAILDLNVAGQEVYPVAEELAARGIPFLFVSGYNASAVMDPYRDRPTLQKPFRPEALKRTLEALLG